MKNYLVNTKDMLAEHKRIIPELKKAGLKKEAADQSRELREIKKKSLKKILRGKGGPSPFAQADAPINLLDTRGEPPTAGSIPRTPDNSLGNKV